MARPHRSMLPLIWAMRLVVTPAHIDTFNLGTVEKENPVRDTDLLVVVDREESLAAKSIAAALQQLDSGRAHLTRDRKLVLSQCISGPCLDKVLQKFLLTPADLPLALLFPQKSDQTRAGRYRLNLKAVEKPLGKIVDFIKAYDDSSLEPYVGSEPVPPASKQRGAVRNVVASSFDSEVSDLDPPKHVLMLFYSDGDASSHPGDTTSAELQPVMEQAAKVLDATRKSSHFRVKRFNADKNELPQINGGIQHIPLIALFRDDSPGDPDVFPPTQKHTIGNILMWMKQMLPEDSYEGMDLALGKALAAAKHLQAPSGHLRSPLSSGALPGQADGIGAHNRVEEM